MTISSRPLLRYHGGKWRLARWIIGYFPPHRVYVEPYGGAASVLLQKPRSYAEVWNDLDGGLVNLFRVLRDPAQARELTRLLRLTPFARAEFELSYLTDGDPVEQARRTIIRSFMGYGSDAHAKTTGFRANNNKSGTTPAHNWMHYPDSLPDIVERLRGVVIENRPAIEVIQQHDGPQTLHYIDPPYPLSTRDGHPRYNYEMTDAEHCELSNVLHSLSGMVVVSSYAGLYDELYHDWERVTQDAYADGARARVECLWFSPSLQAARLPLFAITQGETICQT